MIEQNVAEKRRNSPLESARAAQNRRRYTVAEKLKAVRLYQDEGFSLSLVCQELNLSKSSLEHWLQAYRLAESQPHFLAALRLQPGSASGHFNYGVWLAKQGRLSEARLEFAETLKLDPNDADARKFLQRVEQMK